MDRIELLFSAPEPAPSLPVELYLGGPDGTGPAIPPVTVRASGRITGLHIRVRVAVGVRVRGAARITGLPIRVRVDHDINIQRPLAGTVASRMQDSRSLAAVRSSGWQQARPLQAPIAARWSDAAAVRVVRSSSWDDTRRIALAVAGRDQAALPLGRVVASRFQEAVRLRHQLLGFAGDGLGRRLVHFERFQEMERLRHAVAFQESDAQRLSLQWGLRMHDGAPMRMPWASHWQDAWPPRPGISPGRVPPKPPGEPCYVPGTPVELLADGGEYSPALPLELVFICERHGGSEPGTTVVVPIRRSYIVINNISLHRLDTGAELRAHSFSLSLDYQSWTWSWSASLHQDAAAHLGRDSGGDPAVVVASVNGVQFRLRLERIVEDRRFMPQRRWSVSGKGLASILAAPYAPSTSFSNPATRTAQQLAADVLTVNGAPMGWALDWQITDWQVPAGAWGLQGSYIDAINDIAGAAGGYVQPHPTDATLRVLPRYPSAPWEWASVTPDFEIPSAAAEVVGIEYVDQPAYDKVFIGGTGAGVFGPFKRAGTAGLALAPAINHALITHADVHRARGIAELSNTGRQEHVSLRMQVLPETGVILPGRFVRHTGDRTRLGLVRSTSIEWSRPALRQVIGVETHAA